MDKNNICEKEFEQRQQKILELSDRILKKLDTALNEVDRSVIKLKEKHKKVEYDDELKKPIFEEVSESERVEIIDSVIDTSSLKQIVATLKDVKDIHLGFLNGELSDDDEAQRGVIVLSEIDQGLKDGEGQ